MIAIIDGKISMASAAPALLSGLDLGGRRSPWLVATPQGANGVKSPAQ
jgi:hypothetical protein